MTDVVTLPTAATKRPRQPWKAAREYRAANPWPERHAARDEPPDYERSAALMVAACILKALPEDVQNVALGHAMMSACMRPDNEEIAAAKHILSRLVGSSK